MKKKNIGEVWDKMTIETKRMKCPYCGEPFYDGDVRK